MLSGMRFIVFLCALFFMCIQFIYAGPPYDTDDPQPVDFHHWEFYCSSIGFKYSYATMATIPHVEVNYGVVPNVQLHVIAPMSFYSVKEGMKDYGYGDTEFGVKYRFVNRDSGNFQVGIFPLLEAATGNANENLGNGKAQFYLPLWIQKTIGKWTGYGGGGYWINPGPGNKNYGFIGWQTQYQFVKSVSVGGEVYYVTASEVGTNNDLRFRLGSIIDLTDHHHLLFSIGRSITGNTDLMWYVGYQLTI
jgi:hypothetical protein